MIKALLNKYDYIINQFLLYLFSSKCLYIFFKEKTLHLKLFFFIKFLIHIIDLSLKCHYTASVMFSQMFYVSEAKLFQMSSFRYQLYQNTIHIPTHFLYGNPNCLIFYLCKYVFVFYDFGILQL